MNKSDSRRFGLLTLLLLPGPKTTRQLEVGRPLLEKAERMKLIERRGKIKGATVWALTQQHLEILESQAEDKRIAWWWKRLKEDIRQGNA